MSCEQYQRNDQNSDLDLCGDETTFPHMGHGEANTGLLKRLGQAKPSITRGMQTVILFDVNRIRPRAYIHRHKCHMNQLNLPQGPNECMLLMHQINRLVEGQPGNCKKIFRSKPHSTWDNFFSGDKIFEWLGTNGFVATMTCQCDRLSTEIDKKYLHKKTDTSPRTKVARFMHPIVAVKNTDKYNRVHISFQSTSSCNISTVNALNSCTLYLCAKEKGQEQKRK